ncbi:MAG: hypothetical protein N2381_11215, partial [Armatimonadetes bacterium]|nr:hypothetical protein [Armatimonadota bacterium]
MCIRDRAMLLLSQIRPCFVSWRIKSDRRHFANASWLTTNDKRRHFANASWLTTSSDSEPDAGIVMALFRHLLPFAKAYKARKQPRYCVVLRPDLLPNLPKLWHLSGGQWAVIPIVDGSQHLAEPILASVSDDGEVVALPLVFAYRFRQYPCARIIALGFWGESHPWSRKAWKFAEAAIADMVQLALRRDYIAIRDLMSD